MVLGVWNTSFEPDENPYVLRLEVFDAAGKKITAMQFAQYGGDGTGNKPVPTITTDHLDLKFHIDSKPVTFDLVTPATNACGVVPWSPSLHVNLNVQAEQENKRVHSWRLQYVKGTDSDVKFLKGDEYKAGTSPVNEIVNADVLLKEPVTPANLLGELQSTCAFALILDVWSHVRGNSGFSYAGQKIKAIAIERCNP